MDKLGKAEPSWKLREEEGALYLNFTRKGVEYEQSLDCCESTNYREYCSVKWLQYGRGDQLFSKPQLWSSYKSLLFLEKIHNPKAKPQCTKAYKEERHNTRG